MNFIHLLERNRLQNINKNDCKLQNNEWAEDVKKEFPKDFKEKKKYR